MYIIFDLRFFQKFHENFQKITNKTNFDYLRNLRIFVSKESLRLRCSKIILKIALDPIITLHKIDSQTWNNGNGRAITECRSKYYCEIQKVRRNNWRENSRKKKGENVSIGLRRSQFFNTVSGKYRQSIFSFLVSFQSATRIPFRRIDSTQRVALCILSILLFRIE